MCNSSRLNQSTQPPPPIEIDKTPVDFELSYCSILRAWNLSYNGIKCKTYETICKNIWQYSEGRARLETITHEHWEVYIYNKTNVKFTHMTELRFDEVIVVFGRFPHQTCTWFITFGIYMHEPHVGSLWNSTINWSMQAVAKKFGS